MRHTVLCSLHANAISSQEGVARLFKIQQIFNQFFWLVQPQYVSIHFQCLEKVEYIVQQWFIISLVH